MDDKQESLNLFRQYTAGKDLNELEQYFSTAEHHPIHKWLHYFVIYDRYFSRYRNREAVMVEVGVFKGWFLDMWKHYFDPKMKIIGIDIDPECKKFEREQMHIEIGSQDDRGFWEDFRKRFPHVDIFLDDGAHTMNQQIVTFGKCMAMLRTMVFICAKIFILPIGTISAEEIKNRDHLSSTRKISSIAWYINHDMVPVDKYTESAYSLFFYDSMRVIEKRYRATPPLSLML